MSPGQMWSELRSRFSLIPQGGGRGALRSTDLVPPRGKEAGLSYARLHPWGKGATQTPKREQL